MTPGFKHQISDSELELTPSAKVKFAEVWKDVKDENIEAVRVYVTGGGCSGMTYGMTLTDRRTEFDVVKSEDTFDIFFDIFALNYLRGAKIDYQIKPSGNTFIFHNVFESTGGSGMCGGCGAAGGCG